jgi:hypothetical protein
MAALTAEPMGQMLVAKKAEPWDLCWVVKSAVKMVDMSAASRVVPTADQRADHLADQTADQMADTKADTKAG